MKTLLPVADWLFDLSSLSSNSAPAFSESRPTWLSAMMTSTHADPGWRRFPSRLSAAAACSFTKPDGCRY